MKAALLGYGTIGKGVEILAKQIPGLEIKNVFVLPEFENLPYFTNNGHQVVTDPEIDIVFECLSGTEPANTLITEALKAGKHVITSNKAVVSPNLSRYVKLAKENGVQFRLRPLLLEAFLFWTHCSNSHYWKISTAMKGSLTERPIIFLTRCKKKEQIMLQHWLKLRKRLCRI